MQWSAAGVHIRTSELPESGKLQIQANCWRGKPDQRPSPSEETPPEIVGANKTVETMNGPTTVAGQLPDRGSDWSGADTGYNRFTCNFGFRQRYKAALSIDDLFLDQEKYKVQGSNNVRPFKLDVTTETTPSVSELEDAASTTSTGSANTFNKFPANRDSGIRNPFRRWNEKYN